MNIFTDNRNNFITLKTKQTEKILFQQRYKIVQIYE